MRLIAAQSINAIIDSIQAQVNSEIRNKQQLDNLSSLVSIQALQDLTARLAKIRSILNIQRYNLVFIGQVGAGKTTAICHLLNLVREVDVERTLRSGKKVKIKQTK